MQERKPRKGLKVFVLIILFILVAVGLGAIYLLNAKPLSQGSLQEQVGHEDTIKKKFMNILICGIDNNENRGDQALTDVIMVVSFHVEKNEIKVLQIPRDTFIGEQIPSGKINAAYSMGENQSNPVSNLATIVKEQFQIPIDHYVTITMDGFRKVVDDIGGVEIDMPYEIPTDNKVYNDISIPKGKQRLQGKQAEILVRYRKGYIEGDIGRVKAQRIFIGALIGELKRSNAGELKNLLGTAMKHVKSDLSVGEAYKILNAAMKVDLDEMELFLLPGESAMYNGLSYYSVHKEQLMQLLNEKFRPLQQDLTIEDLEQAYELSNIYSDNDDVKNSVQDILNGAAP